MISGEIDGPHFEKEKTVDESRDYIESDDLLGFRSEVEVLMDYIAQVDRELREVEVGLKRLLRRPF
ncbi:MAG: hypothetical protein J7K08_07390 [Thermoplasmata archaeon]|nr:hypothetical protein [Thermoplasmata archaeon]OYT49206.1 MAG: hypothetical protein B6U83_02765 [Thermoplasmatales archaeon ex4484_36]HDD59900.1 hypothetical protein [Euryarchaeota archaeon]RLF72319.1 MAG: hypothetical protein DRN35_00820 [Thermoplasmata archaeon]RLF72757.1 MAG: hypothetical protein DRN55_05575 [Thermoplasmata archaeon]